jgi:HK97 gp10 family phage protein
MSDGLVITFEGMERFQRDMLEISGPVATRVARRAIRAGGRVIQSTITQMAPQRPDLPSGTALPVGALRGDIELRVKQEDDGSVSAFIGPGKYSAHVARFVEWGHEQSGGEKRLIGGKLEGKFVAAQPFIRPALELSQDEAMAATETAVSFEIAKEVKRLGYL